MWTSLRGPVAVVFACALVWVARPVPAWADAKNEIEAKIKLALEKYDGLEYEDARKQFNAALTLAKRNKLEDAPVVAKVHLGLGIVYFLGLKDEVSARLSFLSATQIDPKIQIDPAYKTAELAALLEEARAETRGIAPAGPGGPSGPDSKAAPVDCGAVMGLLHTPVENAAGGADLIIEAHLGKDVRATRVSVFYRSKGEESFIEAGLRKEGECSYVTSIPGTAMRDNLLHYYVAALDGTGAVLVSKGSEGSPNLIELSAPVAGSSVDENPLANDLGKLPTGPRRRGLVFVGAAIASGAGYVSGRTEIARNQIRCDVGKCFAPGWLTFFPEIGFQPTPNVAISAVARLGLPLGTNIEGHSTLGPAGLVRVRYAPNRIGDGVQVGASIGGGIIRDVIGLTGAEPGMDVDVVALGPLLMGGNVGYSLPVAGELRFSAELSALVGIPVVDEIGVSALNLGVQIDASVGLTMGF